MDGGDDYRSDQARESIVKALESTLRDRPMLPPRFPNDPRQLETVIFQSSSNKEEYMKKINRVLQFASGQGPNQQQHTAPGMNYEMSGGRRVFGGGAPSMMSTHRNIPPDDPAQQKIQHQQAPPNAIISSAPLPPQQQQQQHYAIVTGQMDGHGRILQPPPNPYVQQLTGVMSSQQMNVQPGQNVQVGLGSGSSQQQQQHMLQPSHRMVSRPPLPIRMGQPGPGQGIIIAPDGQRYGMAPQERPNDFIRLPHTRFARAPSMQQGSPHPNQWAVGGPNAGMTGSVGAGGQAVGASPGDTPYGQGAAIRHQIVTMRSDAGPVGAGIYQQTPQQVYLAPRGASIQGPSMGTGSPSRFDQPPRMPPSSQPQYSRHPMGPPSVPVPGQFAPMSSPNPSTFMGPSPAAAGTAPTAPFAQEQSPVYAAATSVGSVGQKYNVPAEPSPATHASDTAVAEDPGYREKIQELHMYLDPLKRMLEQQGDRSSTQSQKLLKIIDIIEGKSKASLDLLLKCEDTLKKMVHKGNEGGKSREAALCQPLFEVVASLVKTSSGNQSLKRAFHLPPLDLSKAKRLCAPKNPDDPTPKTIDENFMLKMAQYGCDTGSMNKPESAIDPDRNAECGNIPISIHREVASLGPRFRIIWDKRITQGEDIVPAKNDTGRFVDMVCTLEDRQLPHVPALRLRVPNDYPVNSPKFDCDFMEYYGSPFLDSLRETLVMRLTKLGSNCSITSVLDNWESTVRQACLSQ